jgi:hypothetical protein
MKLLRVIVSHLNAARLTSPRYLTVTTSDFAVGGPAPGAGVGSGFGAGFRNGLPSTGVSSGAGNICLLNGSLDTMDAGLLRNGFAVAAACAGGLNETGRSGAMSLSHHPT